ncbi:MAG TPA: hypothetical protein VJW73_06920, partial [Gemmatimonadaceae bacterium]|nr:hypothetical protein [Gemmatimonadaceae bacterium]
MLAWRGEQSPITLFIDSLDEGMLTSEMLPIAIIQALQQLDRDRLTVRIACRTGEWPTYVESRLRSLWPDERLEVLEIAPLTREDVHRSAVAHGV